MLRTRLQLFDATSVLDVWSESLSLGMAAPTTLDPSCERLDECTHFAWVFAISTGAPGSDPRPQPVPAGPHPGTNGIHRKRNHGLRLDGRGPRCLEPRCLTSETVGRSLARWLDGDLPRAS